MVSVLAASIAAIGGLWYSNVQAHHANEQAREERMLHKEGQVTDRYTAAVDNLGENKVDVRLGGVYALQRIMQDSPRDQPTVANILATYVRTHATAPPPKGQDLPADVLAAFIALTARDVSYDQGFLPNLRGARLPRVDLTSSARGAKAALGETDLRGADLRHAFLSDADLSGANLDKANLRRAALDGADLREAGLAKADLRDANLYGALLNGAGLPHSDLRRANFREARMMAASLYRSDLSGAYLSDADLRRAQLVGADLRGADLTRADLRKADLTGADLRGADLRNATVTKKQIDTARTDDTTKPPPALT
ncbi:pentapeptide repeat-containing protein [Streptomyces sp. NPDC005955]|uniref:pentapeptide repeat-containing protein n=1 Tax=Streptomyces sp. NPDC005955 TaxID=3364738 RepID=UPI0036BE0130